LEVVGEVVLETLTTTQVEVVGEVEGYSPAQMPCLLGTTILSEVVAVQLELTVTTQALTVTQQLAAVLEVVKVLRVALAGVTEVLLAPLGVQVP
jgi:hypothetical protein